MQLQRHPYHRELRQEALLVPHGLRFPSEVFDSERGYVNKDYLEHLTLGIRQKLSIHKPIMSDTSDNQPQRYSGAEDSEEDDDALSDLEDLPRPAARLRQASYFSSATAKGFLSKLGSFSAHKQSIKINHTLQSTSHLPSSGARPQSTLADRPQLLPPSARPVTTEAPPRPRSSKQPPGSRLLATITPQCPDFQRLNAFAMQAAEDRYRNFISIKDRLRFEKHVTKKSMRERARRKLHKGQQQAPRPLEDPHHLKHSQREPLGSRWSAGDSYYYE